MNITMQAALWRVDDKMKEAVENIRNEVDAGVSTVTSVANVPIGGIILFYGSVQDIPANFELCDGMPPTRVDAKYLGNKPMLIGRFVKGAFKDRDVKANPIVSGSNDFIPHFHDPGTLVATEGAHNHSKGDHRHNVPGAKDDSGGTDTHIALGDDKDKRGKVELTGGGHKHSGGSHEHSFTGKIGASTGANGDIETLGLNQPEHLEVHFIIRVK